MLLSVTNLRELLMSVQDVFWFLGRKLENLFCNTQEVVENTKFEKQGSSSSGRTFMPKFFCIIEYDKPQRTTYEGPKGILTFTAEVLNHFCNT